MNITNVTQILFARACGARGKVQYIALVREAQKQAFMSHAIGAILCVSLFKVGPFEIHIIINKEYTATEFSFKHISFETNFMMFR